MSDRILLGRPSLCRAGPWPLFLGALFTAACSEDAGTNDPHTLPAGGLGVAGFQIAAGGMSGASTVSSLGGGLQNGGNAPMAGSFATGGNQASSGSPGSGGAATSGGETSFGGRIGSGGSPLPSGGVLDSTGGGGGGSIGAGGSSLISGGQSGAGAVEAMGGETGRGGASGSGSSPSRGGSGSASGGSAGEAGSEVAGAASEGGMPGVGGSDPAGGAAGAPMDLPEFSFFVTSLEALQRLSGSSNGFGGDLRYGEADGLSGADKICTEIAEYAVPGSGAKVWRAFLSATKGPDGKPVNAIDRIGDGPWYDALGRVVATRREDLIAERPIGADPEIAEDLPNEYGVPNHRPDPTQPEVDNHDTLTGSDENGKLFCQDGSCTCKDWTSTVGSDGRPRVGHSWPRTGPTFPSGMPGMEELDIGNVKHWISSLNESGCAPGINLIETGTPDLNNRTVGSGGGYGGFYCFALTP